jgi:hypothetical protein
MCNVIVMYQFDMVAYEAHAWSPVTRHNTGIDIATNTNFDIDNNLRK